MDFADLIEYCPESPSVEVVDEGLSFQDVLLHDEELLGATLRLVRSHQQVAEHVVYVCSLCLRQYDLTEDLRGHMIEYHKYQPIPYTTALPQPTAGDCGASSLLQQNDANSLPAAALVTAAADLMVTSVEMRPVPFKDFRLIIRSKMTMRCCVSYSCAYKFENAAKLAMHAKCHTPVVAGQKFKCTECALETTNWRRCSEHLWKQHQCDVDLLHCPLCLYTAHASVLVWRHMRVHKKWRARVLRSLRTVQQRRQKQRQFAVDALKLAQSVPLNKNKYYAEKTCDICDRKFVNGKTLSKHVKTVHNKIKPFICNVCGRKMARKASLTIHMRQHTGEKPLQCKSCKFSTRDPSVRHKHQLRHENVGKFKCEHCAYTCIQTNVYKRHVRLNHPEEYKRIACDQCSYVTITATKLLAHKKDHRKGLIVNCEDSMDATRAGSFKNPRKLHDKVNEMCADCFLPLESVDSLPHEPAVDTGGVTIPAPSEDTQFPTYLNS